MARNAHLKDELTMTSRLLADVVLHITTRDGDSPVLTYSVPSHLCAVLQAGHPVWVPLQQRLVQGVVVETFEQDASRPHNLRDIIDLVDAQICITSTGLHLAAWLATAYRVSRYEALVLLLPPGLSQDTTITWRVTPDGRAIDLAALPERERALLYYLRRRGIVSETEMRRELRDSDEKLRETCGLLRERGVVERTITTSAPRVRPRIERLVRLCIPDEQTATTLESLKRAPKQQHIVRWLIEHAVDQSNTTEAASQTAQWIPTSEVYRATGASLSILQTLEQKGIVALEQRETRRDPLAKQPAVAEQPPPLTEGQRRVWQPIAEALDNRQSPSMFLLHGVTGSGKTEIYLRAVARTLRLGQQALVLVPEIALTTQLVRRFAARFPGQLALLHSHLSEGERYDEWRRLRHGAARVVVGSRSAIFAPLPDLGLIIVDEEHEPSYKQDDTPRYHARTVAMHLGTLTRCVVILGSATPSVESYYAARCGTLTLLEMRERVGMVAGADGLPRTQVLPLPRVRLVDMRHELQQGNRSIFSMPLQRGLANTLQRGEQVILFLNRRGASTFVMCRDCGHVLTCPQCQSSLVLHYEDDSLDTYRTPQTPDRKPQSITLLVCHSCSYRAAVPAFCPHCLSPRIKSFGIGTQQVAQEVQRMFPHARTLRWDRDSVSRKGEHDRLFTSFLHREADILVGTQMIAKGLDLPHVALVGVIAADTALYMPDFRSGERTFQLLTQVAGRAGRRTSGAQVVIQTYTPEHYALQAAQEHDYHAFYQQEIAFRRQIGYPPFSQLVRFLYAHTSKRSAERAAQELATRLATTIQQHHLHDWRLIGPAPAFIQRLRGRWRWHILLRLPTHDADSGALSSFLHALAPLYGWSVDIDPLNVL